jgi:hypothetical protein
MLGLAGSLLHGGTVRFGLKKTGVVRVQITGIKVIGADGRRFRIEGFLPKSGTLPGFKTDYVVGVEGKDRCRIEV